MLSNTKTVKGKPTPAKPATRTLAKKTVTTKRLNKSSGKKPKIVKLEPKVKVVRDSFTMPQSDYSRIGELKLVCQKAGMQVKKGELLRAGLHALGKLSATQLKKTIAQIEHIKTGRPKKG